MRLKQHWTKLVAGVALALLLSTSPIAVAEEQSCAGTLGAVTVDNLLVPQAASCRLHGTRVLGTIKVEAGATLLASNVYVAGNLQAENATRVEIRAQSVVGGSIQIVQSGAALIDSVRLSGDLLLDANDGALIATANRIGGNLQAFQNSGAVTITGNLIDGNLQCKENQPAPIGGGNLVQGNAEDQCAALAVESKPFVFLSLVELQAVTSDTTPPATTIDTGTAASTSSTSASFNFSASEAGATFECALDGVAFTGCVSPITYTGLGLGAHTFMVRAVDPAGNVDPTPAAFAWTIVAAVSCGAPLTAFADADSWVDQNSATNNFGTDAILKVRAQAPADNFRTLVRFALPSLPLGCVVQSAALRLYAPAAVSGRTLEALRIAADWTESGVTWNNQPAVSGAAATTSSGMGYREWNVSAQVQAIYDTGANYGFLIRDAAEGGTGSEQQFHAKEKGENPATLVVSFALADTAVVSVRG
jgi:hypothetical protein